MYFGIYFRFYFQDLFQDIVKKQKGYCVREMEGKYLNDLIPADQLCQVAELADDKSVSWEVVKILNHKGGVGDRLYLVEWKGGLIKLKTTHEFVESQAAKAVVGQTIY